MLTFCRALVLSATVALAATSSAQTTCYDSGSVPTPARVLASPLPLTCSGAATWPMWRQFTPPHRAPAPHPGFRPGDARALPVLLVRYRCTGLWWLPVVPAGLRTNGYVVDQREHPCH